MTVHPSTKGHTLVATPPLEDPNFDRTVLFMIEHNDEGALGVVLNRPSDERVDGPLSRWSDLQAEPDVIFEGGPVEPRALIALARTHTTSPDDGDAIVPVSGAIVSADLSSDPALIGSNIEQVRIFRGYAGWGPGQLEHELDAGAWLTVDTHPDDLFGSQPTDLWRTVLGRQPGRLAWLAQAPDDLSLN